MDEMRTRMLLLAFSGGDIGFFITFDQFDGGSVVLVESMRHQCHLSPTQGEVVVDGYVPPWNALLLCSNFLTRRRRPNSRID